MTDPQTAERCGFPYCRKTYVQGALHRSEDGPADTHEAEPPRRVTSRFPPTPEPVSDPPLERKGSKVVKGQVRVVPPYPPQEVSEPPVEREHHWRGAVKWPHCAVCGVIRREDGKNSATCKGPARLRPFEQPIEASEPPVEQPAEPACDCRRRQAIGELVVCDVCQGVSGRPTPDKPAEPAAEGRGDCPACCVDLDMLCDEHSGKCDCGGAWQAVRPGKYQCPNSEREHDALVLEKLHAEIASLRERLATATERARKAEEALDRLNPTMPPCPECGRNDRVTRTVFPKIGTHYCSDDNLWFTYTIAARSERTGEE